MRTKTFSAPTPVWSMAMILGVGGVTCIFAAIFPTSPTAPIHLATGIGIVCLVASALLFTFGSAVPVGTMPVVAIVATILNSVLVSADTSAYGAALTSFVYLWIAIYAGQFFEQRMVRLQCVAIVIASGGALVLGGLPGMMLAWLLIASSAVLASEALARLNGRLRSQLVTDPLTGLLNRAGFLAAAERVLAVAGRGGMPVSLALIDLDGFKQINDSQGHAAGDELLIGLGADWRRELRGTEVLARVGGDEFALVLAGADRGDAEAALWRLRAASEVEWSVGLVEWGQDESLDRAMARADAELYRAKRDLSLGPSRQWTPPLFPAELPEPA